MSELRRVRNLRSAAGIEKWLLYYSERILRNTFGISLTDDSGAVACVGHGEWSKTRKAGHCLFIEGFGKRTELRAEDWLRLPVRSKWDVGELTLSGVWKIDGVEVGSCTLMNGWELPVLDLVSKPLGCRIKLFRSDPRRAVCPLVVEGFDGYEMVLEDYAEMPGAERAGLPKLPKGNGYVGSLRAMRYVAPESRPKLEGVGLITAITQQIIMQEYVVRSPG